MSSWPWLRLFVVLTALVVELPMYSQPPRGTRPGSKPTESEHIKGPNGLEGWTLKEGDEQLAITLVLARNGVVLHRILSSAIIWKWIFWSDGQEVAYETGPQHFSMMCVLIDTRTGRRIADYDCWQDLPADAPDWAKALEKKQ